MTMTQAEYQQVARTILEQLGDERFSLMTGAKFFLSHPEGGLSFQLPKKPGYTKDGINYVKVTLDPSDTYTVEFGKIGRGAKGGFTTVKIVKDVYAENLQTCFTHFTGLATHL